MILKAYKYRLFPTEDQRKKIDQTINACRLVYNLALEIKTRAYREQGIQFSSYTLAKDLSLLRKEYAWIAEVDSTSLETSIHNIDVAFKNFFNGVGYPKFKKKRNSGSFVCRKDCRKVDFIGKTVSVPKIHNISARISRIFTGEIKRIAISKTCTGKYFASLLVKTQQEEPIPAIPQNAIGIDLGIKDFAALSTGEKISNPKYLASELKRLKVLQRRASRKKKGSNNRKKANLKVSLLHEKITNQRTDFLHKVSTRLIGDNQTDTICVEDLAVKNMVRNHKLSQAISDVSWSEFVRQLEYKGKWYGKNVIKINRFYASSKTCSNCGHKYDELNLSERKWTCSNCNATHDRDINAAINIRNSGIGSPVEPVEVSAVVEPMKQEPMSNQTNIK